jgi:2-desacetyl-2-hydroxyethyl bacteriochlorophyllide A dehydrogenase
LIWLNQLRFAIAEREINLMKQIQLRAPGELVERQIPSPVIAHGEALVRIRRVGVCGSDFHAFAGRHPAYTYPRVLGHELACEVIEVAANEKGIQAGDLCAIDPYVNCGFCASCKAGCTNCCERLTVLGIHVDGGMQSLLPVRTDLLHKSNSLSLDQLAMIETLGIGAHAVARSNLKSGEEALIIGAGPIGLGVIIFAKAEGAHVRVIEPNSFRRTFAESMGAEAIAHPDDRLAHVVFDATGSAESMGKSISYAAPMGRVIFVGLTREAVSIDDAMFHKRELTLYASRNSRNQFPRIIRMMEEDKIQISSWITDRMSLSEVPLRLKDLPAKSGLIKGLVELDDSEI